MNKASYYEIKRSVLYPSPKTLVSLDLLAFLSKASMWSMECFWEHFLKVGGK